MTTWVTREQWGAIPPRQQSFIHPRGVDGLVVHWVGTHVGAHQHKDCAGRVRSIQRYHMDRNRWSDIAYSGLVCQHGFVFEGRGWGVRTAANGTNAANGHYHAFCYLGGKGDPFTAEAKQAFGWVFSEAARRYPHGTDVEPHSKFVATDCPGPEITRWVSNPTTEVTPMFNPAIGIPSPFVAEAWPTVDGKIIGHYQLTEDGRVYAWGYARQLGMPYGKPYWGNRKAALIELTPNGYAVIATTGERYEYGG